RCRSCCVGVMATFSQRGINIFDGSSCWDMGTIGNRTNPAPQIPKSEIADWTAWPCQLLSWSTLRESNLRFRISGFEVQDSSDFRFLPWTSKYVDASQRERVSEREFDTPI